MQPADLSPALHAIHPFVLPSSVRARIAAQGVKIRVPRGGQFSRAVDMNSDGGTLCCHEPERANHS